MQIFSWEDSRSLISASAFNLLHNVILVEVYEENMTTHRYAVGKCKSSLIAISGPFCEIRNMLP